MATISLAEARVLQSSRKIPLIWSADGAVSEPWFDYDEDGNPQDFDMDLEPPDPTMEELSAVDTDDLLYDVSPSQFAETAIRVPEAGRVGDFRFEGREYLRKIYDTVADKVLLTCGRQVEKSTTLGNRLLCYSALTNNFRSIYVAPSAEQAKVFSTDRIKDVIEASPLLKAYTTTKINQAVFFKKFINFSQIRLRYAYLTADRCIAGDSKVQLADGKLVPIRDLVGVGAVDLVSMGEDRLPCISRGFQARSVGSRPVVAVTTDYPVPIKCTPDHRIFTGRGWVAAEDLKEGDFVFAPHAGSLLREKSIGEAGEDGFATAWLLGALVSEGSCVNAGDLRFHNNDETFIEDFERYADSVGLKLGKRVYDTRYDRPTITVSVYSDRGGPGLNGYKKVLWELGEFGSRAEDKAIPSRIFSATLSEKCAFLSALFRGDGWCCADGKYARAGYSTASKRLADGLAHLLWTLGIRTSISKKQPSTDDALGSYTINMNASHTTKLVGLIGEFREGQEYRQLCQRDCKDRVPVSYMWLRNYLRRTYDLSTHSAWVEHGIQLRPGNRKDSVGRRVLESIADKLSDEFLKLLVSPSISWVEVRSVEDSGEEEVFDITVEGTECFQANGLTVHNCRGIPADLVTIDELQDILVDNIPVIEQCAFHSRYKLFLYSGTPKSFDNTLEHYWTEFSTQNEWVVPCEHHGTPKDLSSWHWNVLGEKQIGKKGLICDKCGASISATHPKAQWVSLNPRDEDNKDKVTFDGYRIPQTMVQWVHWDDILQAQEQYSRAQFMNEKLGMSYDSGVRPITKGQLKACCKDEIRLGDIESFKRIAQGRQVYAGVDWGHGEATSHTVISFGGYFGTGNFDIFWIHRFTGPDLDPERQLDLISQMISQLQVQITGTDYGGGFYQNDQLIRRHGPKRVMKYQYNPRQKKKVYWEPNLGRFMLHRTEVMSDVFNALKRKLISLPNWEDFREPHGSDILNIFSEYNERLRMDEYKHAPGKPDDSFHSILYCLMASMLQNPRPDILTPMKDDGSGMGFQG